MLLDIQKILKKNPTTNRQFITSWELDVNLEPCSEAPAKTHRDKICLSKFRHRGDGRFSERTLNHV